MQNWKDLYGELAKKLADNIENLQWVDLWHNQINFLDDEHPFPTPAVFFGFRSQNIQDMGAKVQNVTLQVDVYVYFETFADTYKGSFNQDGALAYLDLLDGVQKQLHGSMGTNYSSMRRLAFSPVDTGNAGNLYLITYGCTLVDYTAQEQWEEGGFGDVEVQPFDVSI